METDTFFYRLFKQHPETLFSLLGQPPERARAYRFDSVELKKAFRIDGLFQPNKPGLPLYFLEVQYQPLPTFYANLFAKVFCYLEENDPAQDWMAVAIFPSRSAEPKQLEPYAVLLDSTKVARIYLDEYPTPADPPVGLGILQLVSADKSKVKELTRQLLDRQKDRIRGRARRRKVVELVEELLVRRFDTLTREEIIAMFHLADIRNTRVWQEAEEEGRILEKKELVDKWLAKGMSAKKIAELLEIPVRDVRRLAKDVPQ
jgi:predicted transposase/invertase (TIGR01784 family)